MGNLVIQRRSERGLIGWPAVSLVGAAFAITMLGTTLPTPLYPLYEKAFGFGELVTTVVFATYAIGVIAALLLFGRWSDQLGRRVMLQAGLVASGLSALVFLLAGALGWLLVGRLLSGLSAGILTGTATATIVDLAPQRGKERVSLIAAAVNMGGLDAGPLLAGSLAQYAPLPLTLCFVIDLVLVAGAVLAVQAVTEPVRPAGTSTYFVMLYIGIAIPVIGEGAAAQAFGLIASGMVFAALVTILAAVALLLLVRGARPPTGNTDYPSGSKR